MTYYYNHLNLPYKITGSENDETQFLYGADGSLLQRKYIKNSVQISKRDYLRDKEIVDNLMESIMNSDGRVIKNGNSWKYEYHIKDHLGNVRVTFSDNNGNGLLVGDEIRSRNDYYPFGDQACSRHRDVSWAKGNVAIAPQVQRGAISEVKTLCSGQSAFAEKEWNNRWELSDTISPLNLKRYNGKELVEDMNLGQLKYDSTLLQRNVSWTSTIKYK